MSGKDVKERVEEALLIFLGYSVAIAVLYLFFSVGLLIWDVLQ